MKAVVITGISGGLGKAFFDLLTAKEQEPMRIVAIGRRFLPEQVKTAAENPSRIFLVEKDLNEVGTLPTSAELADWLGGDAEEIVFLNNAAVVEPIGPVGELDPALLEQAVRVNVTAQMVLTNALFGVPKVREDHVQVKVLNISSGAAKRPIDGWAMYCAVKAGMEMFFDVLAQQYAEQERVQIRNVNPGVMDTGMQEKIRSAVAFPTQERFLNLKRDNQLPSPEQVAAKIWAEHA